MANYEIDQAGYLFVGGKKVEQFTTPNMSGTLDPVAIIDHDTASNPANWHGPVSWLCMPQAYASAHVCIDWKGTIRQLVPFTRIAWHAGASKYGTRVNYNSLSIGIEHDNPGWLKKVGDGVYQGVCTINTKVQTHYHVAEGLSTQWHPAGYCWLSYSDEQLEASVELHRALKVRFPKLDEVLGHYHICPGRKTDVNPLFPLSKMQGIIRGRADEVKPVETTEPRAPVKPVEQKEIKTFHPDATVMASSLNLRAGPGTSFHIKGAIPYGTRIDVQDVDVNTGWLRIITPAGYTGYVSDAWVRRD